MMLVKTPKFGVVFHLAQVSTVRIALPQSALGASRARPGMAAAPNDAVVAVEEETPPTPPAWTCLLMGYDRAGLRRLEWLGLVRLLDENGRLSEPFVWFYNENGRDSGLHGIATHMSETNPFNGRQTRTVWAGFSCLGQWAWEQYGTYVELHGTDEWMEGRDSRGRAVRAAPIAFFRGRDELSFDRLRAVARMLWRAGQADQFNRMLPNPRQGPPLVELDGWQRVEVNETYDAAVAGEIGYLWVAGDTDHLYLEDEVWSSERCAVAAPAPPLEEVAPQSAAPAPPLEEVASQSSAPAPPLEEVQLVVPAPPLDEEVPPSRLQ